MGAEKPSRHISGWRQSLTEDAHGQKGDHALRVLSGEEDQAFGGGALCGGTPYEPDIAEDLSYHDL